jgi:acyl phosphate:glycerol-3-phosphate acyltransferase
MSRRRAPRARARRRDTSVRIEYNRRLMSESPRTLVLALGLVPLAYVLGSVPFGLIVGRSRGVDPRAAGSGNIGATNVGRLLGKKFFALVFVLDLLKGLVPVVLAGLLLRNEPETWHKYVLWLAAGFAAILGHLFSVFLRFKGGKGVATSAGVILGVYPWYTYPGLVAALAWVVLFKLTRYVSLASMLAAATFTLVYAVTAVALHRLPGQWPLLAFAVLVTGLIVYKHRGNIARLRAGTEFRYGSSAGAAARNGAESSNGDSHGDDASPAPLARP